MLQISATLVVKVTALVLLVNPGLAVMQPEQTAQPHQGVTVIKPEGELWKQIPTDLHWTAKQIADAKLVIETHKKEMQIMVDTLKAKGADRIVTRPNRSLMQMFDAEDREYFGYYSEFGKGTLHTKLVGYKGKKKITLGQEGWWPYRAIELSLKLMKLNSKNCNLTELHWFNPLTWFDSNRCEILVPTPEQYLRGYLITLLFVGKIHINEDLPIRNLESLVEEKAPYKIENNLIYSLDPDFYFFPGSNYMALSDDYCGFGYEILFGKNKWDATFKVAISTPQEFAEHMVLDIDYSGGSADYNFTVCATDW